MNRSAISVQGKHRVPASPCIDPVVGAILSGWRYDISALSPEMRTDYERHFEECEHCRSKQHLHRGIDVLLISVSTLSIMAFLLAAIVMRRVENMIHIAHLPLHLHHSVIFISLEAVAVAGLLFSVLLWLLVAIATPLPSFLTGVVARRLPAEFRERFHKHAA
ncbi:MAG TPA: hypothetical protein VGC07_03270 [Granulicella sp.]